jgi:hypothetical protein
LEILMPESIYIEFHVVVYMNMDGETDKRSGNKPPYIAGSNPI